MRISPAYLALAVSAVVLLFTSEAVSAQPSTVTQHVTIVVKPVTRVTVSGNPQPLAITELVPGSLTASVTDQSTSYSIYSNIENARITASINAPVPQGTSLRIGLNSSLGTSRGLVDISGATQAVDVVAGINRGFEVNQPITYTFSANVNEAQSFEGQTRTVTLTILQ